MKAKIALLCQMDADPPELELSWYLNGRLNERRPLSAHRRVYEGHEQNGSETKWSERSPLGGQREQSPMGKRKPTTITSQLNYQVETNLDYGRLYCLARNSLGEQKLACAYDIKPVGE